MDRLPLHVLTGFLGSGKTTLLNRLVRAPEFADSAVLINEIGLAAIDHYVVRRVEDVDGVDIVVLPGGCTCCTVRGDLVAALRTLYDGRAAGTLPPFRRVVLETTGLADPAPILFTLVGDPLLRHKFEAGPVMATVDAVHGMNQFFNYPECRKQIAVADRVVVTKTDLATAKSIRDMRVLIRGVNPVAEIFDASELHAIGGLLDAAGSSTIAWRTHLVPRPDDRPSSVEPQERSIRGTHTAGITTSTIFLEEPVEWSAFAVWLSLLLHARGADMLRFKALLDVRDSPTPVVLNAIHHLVHPPIHLPSWPAGPRCSRLVFVTRALAAGQLETSLREFLDAAQPGPKSKALAFARGSSIALVG